MFCDDILYFTLLIHMIESSGRLLFGPHRSDDSPGSAEICSDDLIVLAVCLDVLETCVKHIDELLLA